MNELHDRHIATASVIDELAKGESLRESLIHLLVASPLSERYVRDKVIDRAYPEGQELLHECAKLIGSFDKLADSFQGRLPLDWNWMIAVCCFAAGDYAIQSKATELSIDLNEGKEGKSIPKNSKKLLEEIIKIAGGQQTELRLFNVYNQDYRNGVIHRGQPVDQKAVSSILDLTVSLLETLFPL